MTHEDETRDCMRALLHHIHQLSERIEHMALNLDALNKAVADNTTATTAAVAALHSPSQQAAVDAATAAIDANTAALNAADAPPAA